MMPDNYRLEDQTEMMPFGRMVDDSDGVFSVVVGQPGVSLTPSPSPVVSGLPEGSPEDLKKLRSQVLEMILRLQTILEQLNKLLGI